MSGAITVEAILEAQRQMKKMLTGVDLAGVGTRDRSVAALLCAPGALERAGVPRFEPKPGEELTPSFTLFGLQVIETDALMPLPRPPVTYRGRPLASRKRRLRKKLTRRLPWTREERVFLIADEFLKHLAAEVDAALGRLFR